MGVGGDLQKIAGSGANGNTPLGITQNVRPDVLTGPHLERRDPDVLTGHQERRDPDVSTGLHL